MTSARSINMPERAGTPATPSPAAFGERCFWVNNGPVLSTLKDLARAFRTMTSAQYRHHTSSGRSDFAAWVEEVLGDGACAGELRSARTKTAAARIVDAHVAKYR